MDNIIENVKGGLAGLFFLAYLTSMPIGVGFSITRDSWPDALLSVLIPLYGFIYTFVGS